MREGGRGGGGLQHWNRQAKSFKASKQRAQTVLYKVKLCLPNWRNVEHVDITNWIQHDSSRRLPLAAICKLSDTQVISYTSTQ